jgi:uncharacterized protein (TIGR03118 family)
MALALGTLLATSSALAQQFNVTNLVTDDPSVNAAQITDPGLLNAWGLSYSPSGPFWISSNGAGTAPLYQVDPLTQATTKLGLTVTVPGGPEGVTGQVFNSAAAGGAFNGNLFLFVSTDGQVSGWRPTLGSTAESLSGASSGKVYTGAAFGSVGNHSYLYAANFLGGTVDVYKGTAAAPNLSGSFTDPNLPTGYSPFNVQNLGDKLYVAYAKQGEEKDEEQAGAGFGFVDVFNLQGHLLARVASGGTLNAPWGLAVAPSSFGALAGDLLVGNFGDGRINVYDPHTHSFIGQVQGTNGQPLVVDGLWAIAPGNDTKAGSSALLYFTAGPDDEKHGLFGVLTAAVPEPSTYVLLLGGLVAIGLRRSIVGTWMRRRDCSS